jgi:hypothetical protein
MNRTAEGWWVSPGRLSNLLSGAHDLNIENQDAVGNDLIASGADAVGKSRWYYDTQFTSHAAQGYTNLPTFY